MSLPNRLRGNGPVTTYLKEIMASEEGRDAARRAVLAVNRCLATDDGAILLELLEKATVAFFLPPDADPRALDALNAQRFIALDLRRIASDESDRLLQPDGPGPRR